MLASDDTLNVSDEENTRAQGSSPIFNKTVSDKPADLLLEDGEDVHLGNDDVPASKLRLDDPVPVSVAAAELPSNSAKPIPYVLPRKDYTLHIEINTFERRGDGINAYLVYKVETQAAGVPGISDKSYEVWRRFSDFLGLHGKLVEKYLHRGVVIPAAPEKSIAAMTRTKSSAADSTVHSGVGVRRARQLTRFLRRIVEHPQMRADCDVRDFITMDAELPRASNTVALSTAGVKRFMKSVGEAFSKMAFHMEEADRWFDQTQAHVDELEDGLRRLLALAENLQTQRKELALASESLAKALSMLASCEESTALARALSHLTETEENISATLGRIAENDQAHLVEAVGEYVSLFQSLKDVFNERVRIWQSWQQAQADLRRKREQKSRFELAGRVDKAQQAKDELEDAERRVDSLEAQFGEISKLIQTEVARFDAQRREDMRHLVVEFFRHLVVEQAQILKLWERFAPEAQSILV